ncbi:hypothetical protein [Mesorhizobium sp.]|uniref:hypothetical protein n=1 Tax=Mesorhizobium sp. TaxID=1871066 RepID=UPI000FE7C54A|nr:hypothetical protein [Mesorhizobium sp.]RWG02556.1 MAG: hypothetical protein EOQ54_19575 [Mesorhizobium sp.]RWH00813.1 MAG: hypothetical protein EOQ72_09445 [Mesorhizobium sp.]TIN43524.1 MAG: hypothetical protein E5Y25_16185 [Mesorhizobium sp.]TIR89867.1 MAG: hypothetical protein E5X08_25820 [Mesorhizobium sp.]
MAEKFFQLMKLSMGRHPTVNAEVYLQTLIDACKFFRDKDEAISYIVASNAKADAPVDESNAIYISDLSDTADYFSLLLVRGDPGRGLPGFVNPQKRLVKPIKTEEPGDVPGASAHLIVSKQAIAAGGNQGRHRMALERTRGIGRSLAKSFMADLLGRYAKEFPEKFVAEKKRRSAKEKPETIQYRPTVSFNPQPNASLKKDLEEGRIGGFKLVRGTKEFQGEADEPKIEHLDVKLTARIQPTADFGKVRSLIDHVRQSFDGIDFEALNLELVDDAGLPLANTPAIAIDNLEEADMRYCKTVPIDGLVGAVSECYDKFQDVIIKAGRAALHADKHWK